MIAGWKTTRTGGPILKPSVRNASHAKCKDIASRWSKKAAEEQLKGHLQAIQQEARKGAH